MITKYKYRVWCNTEAKWIETDFTTLTPSGCPNNNLHSINQDETTIIDTEKSDELYIECEDEFGTNSIDWQRKLRMTLSDIPSGTYEIEWYFEYNE